MEEGTITIPEGISIKDDLMLKMMKDQGYVPTGCYLSGMLVFALQNEGVDPCKGCGQERSICGGRDKPYWYGQRL